MKYKLEKSQDQKIWVDAGVGFSSKLKAKAYFDENYESNPDWRIDWQVGFLIRLCNGTVFRIVESKTGKVVPGL